MIRSMLAGFLLLGAGSAAGGQTSDNPLQPYLKEAGTSFVLENARLIDGSGSAARDGVTIVLEGGRIISVRRRPSSIPAGAKRIDLTGHTVLPGLVMMHEHINYFSGSSVWNAMPSAVPKLLLAAGVTTARTAGAEAPQIDLNLKRRIDSGRVPGPRLFVTGGYLNGPVGDFLGDNVVRTAEEVRAVTAFWAMRGVTSIKVYSAISPEALRGTVEEANRRGIHVAGHLGATSCAEAAKAGIHTIEHSLLSCAKDIGFDPDARLELRYDAVRAKARTLIALLVARDVTLVATPPTSERYEPSPEQLSMLSPDQLARYDRSLKSPPPWLPSPAIMATWNAANRAFERDFVAAGGRLLIGADASDFGLVPGYANHDAMIALVRAGFPPTQVVRFATSDAAKFLGVEDEIGTVAAGRLADLLIVRGEPDRRIEDIRNVTNVFKDGIA